MVNEWTRDDLPTTFEVDLGGCVTTVEMSEEARDGIIGHLNTHHPKPTENVAEQLVALDEARIEANIQRNRAERERDAAVARAEKAESERDHGLMEISEFREELAAACARAEKAERERDEWKARAEAAEARTAPAVAKAEIEKAVRSCFAFGAWNGPRVEARAAIDAVWALLSGDDPVVYVVRESGLPDVERDEDGDWLSESLVVDRRDTAEDLRGRALSQLKHVAMREAVARAIEAEQATDPVEELAGQIETATRDAIRTVVDSLTAVAPGLTPPDVEGLLDQTIRDQSHTIAAHVLGQKEDQ